MIHRMIKDRLEGFTNLEEDITVTLHDGHEIVFENGDVNFLASDGKLAYTISQVEFYQITQTVAQQAVKETLTRLREERKRRDNDS